MIHSFSAQEDDWMVVISNSVFNKIWTRVKKVPEWCYFVKVVKMMDVDEIVENTNTIAILAFVVITIKLIVVPALFNNYWNLNEKLFQDSRLFPEKFLRGAINEY